MTALSGVKEYEVDADVESVGVCRIDSTAVLEPGVDGIEVLVAGEALITSVVGNNFCSFYKPKI
jgi:hypothetical protein